MPLQAGQEITINGTPVYLRSCSWDTSLGLDYARMELQIYTTVASAQELVYGDVLPIEPPPIESISLTNDNPRTT